MTEVELPIRGRGHRQGLLLDVSTSSSSAQPDFACIRPTANHSCLPRLVSLICLVFAILLHQNQGHVERLVALSRSPKHTASCEVALIPIWLAIISAGHC